MPTRIDIQHRTGLLLLVRPRTVGIDPALDFRDPLLTKNHFRYFDRSPDEDRNNGYQPNSETDDRLHHAPLPEESGGADRDRTGGLLVANQALSQLSYSPFDLVGLGRVELPTSPLSGVRSSHLSYRPGFTVFPQLRVEPRVSSFDRAKLGARRSQLDVFRG